MLIGQRKEGTNGAKAIFKETKTENFLKFSNNKKKSSDSGSLRCLVLGRAQGLRSAPHSSCHPVEAPRPAQGGITCVETPMKQQVSTPSRKK